MKRVTIQPSTNSNKKLMATFETNGREKTVHFGAKGYKDFTIYHKTNPSLANQKKEAYDARHKVNENWNDPMSAGALSKWILWNKPTIESSIQDFKQRFKY